MSQAVEKEAEIGIAALIFKTSKMGSQAITDILPKIKDSECEQKVEKMREELTRQFAEYERISVEAEKFLRAQDIMAQEENLLVKMTSKAGIFIGALGDSSPSHIAEMMIKGLNMGITEMIAKAHECRRAGCDGKILSLADRLVSFQEDAVERIKNFL